jgi:hypothetical protein
MIMVAIIGFNCWAIRMILDSRNWSAERVGIGGLPIANILITVLLLRYRCRGGRRFLLGFEVFGTAAVVILCVLMIRNPRPPFFDSYLRLVTDPLIRAWKGPGIWNNLQLLIGHSVVSLWVTLPQLAFAMIGGFVFRNFWQSIRKPPSTASTSEVQNDVLPASEMPQTFGGRPALRFGKGGPENRLFGMRGLPVSGQTQ